MDSYPEGYVPCDCHPETCNHRDGMVFVGFNKPLADKITKEGKKNIKKIKKVLQKDKWSKIPYQCEYQGKTYRILDIDLQGGYFTLYDPEAKKGEVQVLAPIDMEKCNPIKK